MTFSFSHYRGESIVAFEACALLQVIGRRRIQQRRWLLNSLIGLTYFGNPNSRHKRATVH